MLSPSHEGPYRAHASPAVRMQHPVCGALTQGSPLEASCSRFRYGLVPAAPCLAHTDFQTSRKDAAHLTLFLQSSHSEPHLQVRGSFISLQGTVYQPSSRHQPTANLTRKPSKNSISDVQCQLFSAPQQPRGAKHASRAAPRTAGMHRDFPSKPGQQACTHLPAKLCSRMQLGFNGPRSLPTSAV